MNITKSYFQQLSSLNQVDINDRTIAIISEALGGSNVENCPHACVARPCGPLAKCVPNLDTYECQCNPQNRQCNKAEELPSEVIEKQQRLLKRKQQEQTESQRAMNAASSVPVVASEQPPLPLTTLPGTSISTTPAPPEDSTLPHDNNPADVGDGSSEESDEGYSDYYQNDDEDDDDDDGDDSYGTPGMNSGNDYNQPRGSSSTKWTRYQSAAGEIKMAPPASSANEADKQQSLRATQQLETSTAKPTTITAASVAASTSVANEKIIVWIDRQKSKDSFSTQSNDYADYGGGEMLVESGEMAVPEAQDVAAQHTASKKTDFDVGRGNAGVYDPSTGTMVVNDRKMMMTVNGDADAEGDGTGDMMPDDGDDDDATRDNRRPQVNANEPAPAKHHKTVENNHQHQQRRPEAKPETLPASNKDTGKPEPSSSFHGNDDDNNDSNSAYDGDGYGKDYDQHGDRIPYRPDFLLHRKGIWRAREGRQHRQRDSDAPVAQDEPEIDETLIEEMNRIMKNHNDNDNDADEMLDSSFWGVATDGFGEPSSLAHHDYDMDTDGADSHGGGVEDGDDDDGDHHRPHHDHHEPRAPVSHHRRRNGVVEEQSEPSESQSYGPRNRYGLQRAEQQQQQHQQDKQQQQAQEDPRNEEDDILRSIKYKNKYFRKYQGACFTGTDSYFHYSDAETMRRVISYEIDLNLRFKTHSANGLILWTGRHSALEGDDFLSLGIENG
uniref:LAM_G_DOMAIN domain-containing protein n=1 Tax=Anopheles maculatus TaxID=74869 RepID=A0A182T6F7_9DIPT